LATPKTAKQRAARARLQELFAHPKSVFLVHYACESFDQAAPQGSPRIIAIALRNLDSGQTLSFSVHEELELTACPPALARTRMDQLEYRLLATFYRFLASNKTARFAHWSMSNAKFGFEAIAHRYAVHGGDRNRVPHIDMIDLAQMLGDIYGHGNLPKPHFDKLAELNNISRHGFLVGAAEPAAFSAGNYRAVRDSVLAKVSIMAQIAELANDRALKTNANWYVMNVGRVREAVELFQDNPVKAMVGGIGAAVVVGFTLFTRMLT
jgi:hypothetical protein